MVSLEFYPFNESTPLPPPVGNLTEIEDAPFPNSSPIPISSELLQQQQPHNPQIPPQGLRSISNSTKQENRLGGKSWQ